MLAVGLLLHVAERDASYLHPYVYLPLFLPWDTSTLWNVKCETNMCGKSSAHSWHFLQWLGFEKDMTLLCGWHQISGISREVEFSGCPGTRQCPGSKEMGIKVKVERMLVLFCSCAVQREVFLPGAERGEGTVAGVCCCLYWIRIIEIAWVKNRRVSSYCFLCLPKTVGCYCFLCLSIDWWNGWMVGSWMQEQEVCGGVTVLPAWQDWCVVCWCGYGAVGRCG